MPIKLSTICRTHELSAIYCKRRPSGILSRRSQASVTLVGAQDLPCWTSQTRIVPFLTVYHRNLDAEKNLCAISPHRIRRIASQ